MSQKRLSCIDLQFQDIELGILKKVPRATVRKINTNYRLCFDFLKKRSLGFDQMKEEKSKKKKKTEKKKSEGFLFQKKIIKLATGNQRDQIQIKEIGFPETLEQDPWLLDEEIIDDLKIFGFSYHDFIQKKTLETDTRFGI